jgi:hypothetical protein
MAVPCVSIKLGGTVTDAGITGGIDIGDLRYQVNDWSGLWGSIPIRANHARISGRAGRVLTGSKLPDFRLLTLNLRSLPWDPTGGWSDGAGYSDEECGQIIENLLGLTGFFGDSDPLVIEWVIDTARSLYLETYAVQGAQVFTQGKYRLISQPLEASYPYWREDVLQTDTISGADTITNSGTAQVWDPILVFSGDGTFENLTTGQEYEVAGSGGAVTVDVGRKLVLEGGADADGVGFPDSSQWMRLAKGVNSVTSDVSVDVKWRPGYK